MSRSDPLRLLRLLQLADSGFPTGGFAFSNGLEGLAHLGMLPGEAAIAAAIQVQVEEGLAGVELPAALRAHALAEDNDLDALAALDDLLSALKPVAAFRLASLKTGRRFLASAAAVVDDSLIAAYHEAARPPGRGGHHAIAWGVVCARAGIEAEPAALAFGSTALQGQTAATVRLGLIGQAAAQRIVTALQPALVAAVDAAATLEPEAFGAYQPFLDIAGLRQPALDSRLFAS